MSSKTTKKVVNPPQNPVIRKTFIDGEIKWVFSAIPKKMPMMKLPATFTVNVPTEGRIADEMGELARQKTQAGADKAAHTRNKHRFEHTLNS